MGKKIERSRFRLELTTAARRISIECLAYKTKVMKTANQNS